MAWFPSVLGYAIKYQAVAHSNRTIKQRHILSQSIMILSVIWKLRRASELSSTTSNSPDEAGGLGLIWFENITLFRIYLRDIGIYTSGCERRTCRSEDDLGSVSVVSDRDRVTEERVKLHHLRVFSHHLKHPPQASLIRARELDNT